MMAKAKPENEQRIKLADLVLGIRQELEDAVRHFQSLPEEKRQLVPGMKVEKIQLEAEIVSVRNREVEGGVDVYVKLGGKGSQSTESSQKVVMILSGVNITLGSGD
jgi:hypothetical protein